MRLTENCAINAFARSTVWKHVDTMKWVTGILGLILLIVAAGGGGAWWWAHGSLPQTSGTLTVQGLAEPVEIVRDRHGVPHIYAQSMPDASFALGYVHAQDRLWQMEMNRRIGAGRLSELFGERSLGADKFLRTLGVYRVAERTVLNLEGDARAALDAYAAGVNAYIDGLDGPLPPEFLILRHRPEPWTPADSVVWAKMMAFNLSTNWRNELLRARLARVLTAQQIAEAFPPYPDDAPVALADLTGLYKQLPDRVMQASGWYPPTLRDGSNNWVVDGNRTASGKPLLANDPHLGLSTPAVWYFVHVDIAGKGVIGASLPGTPAVLLGRNDRTAWGFTNTGSDNQDIFIEKIDPSDPNRYITPMGPAQFETRRETIDIRGGDPIDLTIRATRHGPVISDVLGSASDLLTDEYALAFAWPALADDDMTVRAGLNIMRAENWDDFLAAVRDFHVAQQNIVYADVDGNIGFVAPGRVPVRKPENDVRGMMPVPGWDARYDWDGWIPFEQLPQAFNPPSGLVVTANNKIVPETYPHHLTFEWDAPFRAQRIKTLLQTRSSHSLQSFMAMQSDVLSTMATTLLPWLRQVEPMSEEAKRALRLLEAWDGTMGGNSIEPTIFSAWLRELTRLVFEDEFGDLFADYWGYRPLFTHNVLRDMLGQSRWCDDVRTAETETCAGMLSVSLDLALADLADRYGEDPAGWRWSIAHPVRQAHRPFSDVPLLNRLFEIKQPFEGGNYTINRAASRLADDDEPFTAVHGSSLRAIYDLSDPDSSVYIHSTGQSGNPLSPHYDDLSRIWLDGGYIPMTMNRADIEDDAIGMMRIRPPE